MKKILRVIFMLIFIGFIAACGSTTEGEDQNQTNDSVESVEVVHELGTTVVPKNPQTIAIFDFASLDILNHFNVEVAALPQGNVPGYLSQYESDHYQNAGTLFEPDFEMLANLNPDLIIISGRTQESYADLSELAPTIYLGIDTENYLDSFKENVSILADIFEKEELATEAIAQIDADVAEVIELVPSDKTGLIILTSDGSLSAYGPGSRFGMIHDELGVASTTTDIEATTHGQNISFEFVTEVDPDYLFVMDRNAVTGGDYTASTTLDNPLINQTTAVENNQVTYLTPDYWYLSSGGIESVSQMIAEIKATFE